MSSALDDVCVDQSGAYVTCAHAASHFAVNPGIVLLVGLACAVVCGMIASRKNRSVALACILGFVFGLLSIVGYAVVRKRPAFA
jgi:hypothetical protein